MHRAVEELRTSGAADRVLKVGDKAPNFVLRNAAEQPLPRTLASALYVATDPDREGEAIGWHLTQELPFDKSKIFPGTVRPSCSVTWMSLTPSTTWSLVRM